jgi:predicted dehydrogenase
MRKMRLFQRNAYISMDFADGFSEIFYLPDEKQSPFRDGVLALSLGQIDLGEHSREIKYSRLARSNVNPLKLELSSFLEAIGCRRPVKVSAQDGLAALRLANAVLREIDHHQRVAQSQPASSATAAD